jgi:hypothetical protein
MVIHKPNWLKASYTVEEETSYDNYLAVNLNFVPYFVCKNVPEELHQAWFWYCIERGI